jgi:hypothetical protein
VRSAARKCPRPRLLIGVGAAGLKNAIARAPPTIAIERLHRQVERPNKTLRASRQVNMRDRHA